MQGYNLWTMLVFDAAALRTSRTHRMRAQSYTCYGRRNERGAGTITGLNFAPTPRSLRSLSVVVVVDAYFVPRSFPAAIGASGPNSYDDLLRRRDERELCVAHDLMLVPAA